MGGASLVGIHMGELCWQRRAGCETLAWRRLRRRSSGQIIWIDAKVTEGGWDSEAER